MKRPSRIVRLFKNVFKISKWLDWQRIKALNVYLANGFKRVFTPQKQVPSDLASFEEAVTKFNLNEEYLVAQQKSLFFLVTLMLTLATLIFLYSAYQLFFGSFSSFIISLIVTLIALGLAFRYHFWYFQIKKRKLGCSFLEWYKEGLLGVNK